MIDVHCHANFHAYKDDADEVIQNALKNGVEIIINVGTKLDSSEKAIALAQKYEHLYAIVGVHPHHADKLELDQDARSVSQNNKGVADLEGFPTARKSLREAPERALAGRKGLTGPRKLDKRDPMDDVRSDRTPSTRVTKDDTDQWLIELEKLAKQPKVVAIGEIGMDYYRYQSNGITDPKLQKEIFEQQIALAHKVNLPLQIHNRHAGKDVIEILRHHKNILKRDHPGMFHCFAGDMDVLKAALDLGFYIGFDGNITYKGLAPGETVSLSDLAKETPLDRIVTETDSPFLTPVPYRGSRNEPHHVIIVGEFIAKIKQRSFEEIDHQTSQNAKTLFGI